MLGCQLRIPASLVIRVTQKSKALQSCVPQGPQDPMIQDPSWFESKIRNGDGPQIVETIPVPVGFTIDVNA